MGFLGMSGNTWKKIGGYALKAAPIVAAPFTGGLSLAAIGAGAGIAGSKLGGGDWKSALVSGGLGAIPGVGTSGGLAKGALAPTLKAGLTQAAKTGARSVGTSLVANKLPGPAGTIASTALGALPGMGAAPGTSWKTGLTNVATSVGKSPSTYASFLGAGGGGGSPTASGGPMAAQPGGGFTPLPPSAWRTPGFVPPAGGGGGIGSFLPPAAGGMFGSGTLMSRAAPATKSAGKGQTPAAAAAAPGGANPNGPAATTGEPSGWWGKYGPLITQGAGAAAAWYGGKKMQEAAQKRSPEEQQALGGAQGVAGDTSEAARSILGEGRPYLQQAGNYYQTLLRGSRGAMQQAVAGPTAQLTDVYRGAERGLERSGIRGAARDVAASDLNRERASKIAGLTTGVQPAAAEALAKMGSDAVSQAGSLYGTSGGVYANLLNQGYENRKYAREEGTKAGTALGGLVRDIGQTVYDTTRKKTGAPTGGGPTSSGLPGTSFPIPTAPTGGSTIPGGPTLPGQQMPMPQIPTAVGMNAGTRTAATAQPGGFMAPKKNIYKGVLGGGQSQQSPWNFSF